MDKRKIIGAGLIVVSIALFVIVWLEIQKYVTLTGLRLGSQAIYNPPFEFHGPLVVLGGVCAVVLLLVGLYLLSPRRK